MQSIDAKKSFPRQLLTSEVEKELELKGSQNLTRKMNCGDRSLNEYDKLKVAYDFLMYFNESQRSFARERGISQTTLSRWIEALREYVTTGMLILHSKGGRPKKIDESGVGDVLGAIGNLVNAQHAPSTSVLSELLVRAAQQTKRRRGESGASESVSKTFLYEFMEKHDLGKATVQLKTDARIEAEADPRNAYSMICLVKGYCEGLDTNLIMNWDATQYIVSDELQLKGIYIKAERGEAPALTAPSAGGLSFAVKLYHLHNCSGVSAPPVFVVADDNLPEDVIHCKQVKGLGMRGGPDAFGWVCLSKTRACNPAFYRWFCREVLCPFVVSSRDDTVFDDENAPRYAFVACDGEAKQIEVFQEEEMLGVLDEHKIVLVKTPASCSAICQPSDVSSFFKASKKRLAYIPRNERKGPWQLCGALQEDDDELEMELRLLYANKAVKARLQSSLENSSFSVEKRSKVVEALQRIIWAVRDTLRDSVVAEGYERIGWGTHPSFDKAMSKCTAKIPLKMMKQMKSQWTNMSSTFFATGKLTEEEMDAANIPSVNHADARTTPKDQRVLHQQRAVVLNSPACVAAYRDYKQRKADEMAQRKLRRQERATYLGGLVVYDRWLQTLTPEQQLNEKEVFTRGKKRRIHDLLAEWDTLNPEECPWMEEVPASTG